MAKAIRPVSIRKFERLFYLGLAVNVVNVWAVASFEGAQTDAELQLSILLISLVASTAINLLFLWLIAYRASNVARWIFIGLVALSVIALVARISHALDEGAFSLALTLAQFMLCAIEIVLLFQPDSRDWFAGRRPIDPEIFS
jgi:hypothetical protein